MNAVDSIFRLELETTWRMAFVIVGFMVMRSFLRGRVSPRLVYCIWIAVAILLLIPFSVPAKWSPFNLLRIIERHQQVTKKFLSAKEGPGAFDTIPTPSPLKGENRQEQPPPRNTAYLIRASACVWILGVLVLASIRISAYRRFATRLKAAVADPGSVIPGNVERLLVDIDMEGVGVIITDLIETPALFGITK